MPGRCSTSRSFQRRSTDAMTLHVRAAGEPSALAGTIRREMQALDATTSAVRGQDARGSVEGLLRAANRQAAVLATAVWHPGAAAERNRRLRRHRVGGQPPDARYRHPHGPRRRPQSHRPRDGPARSLARSRRASAWASWARSRSLASPAALLYGVTANDSATLCGDVGAAGRRVPDRDLYPRPSGDAF